MNCLLLVAVLGVGTNPAIRVVPDEPFSGGERLGVIFVDLDGDGRPDRSIGIGGDRRWSLVEVSQPAGGGLASMNRRGAGDIDAQGALVGLPVDVFDGMSEHGEITSSGSFDAFVDRTPIRRRGERNTERALFRDGTGRMAELRVEPDAPFAQTRTDASWSSLEGVLGYVFVDRDGDGSPERSIAVHPDRRWQIVDVEVSARGQAVGSLGFHGTIDDEGRLIGLPEDVLDGAMTVESSGPFTAWRGSEAVPKRR